VAEKCLAPEEPKAEKTLLQNKAVSYGLARDRRLHLKRDFEDIFKNGQKVSSGGLVLWHRLNPDAPYGARMGIAVSRKLGTAPRRNRIKRLLREVFRLNGHKLKHGAAFVISPRESGKLKDFNSAQSAVFGLWKKAGITRD
jgi:ribonuclease P protein component